MSETAFFGAWFRLRTFFVEGNMKRKNLFIFLVTICLLVLSIGLTACGGVNCKVNFVVDENVYDTVATNGNETIKLPSNPVKDGYEFEGWYWDNGKWEKPFTVNSLLNTPLAADMSVYAKFTHKEHSFDKETVVAPTCTEKGYTLKECECGETTKTNYVLSVEHTYSDFEIRTEATTYSTGIKERICTVCGFVDSAIILKDEVLFEAVEIYPSNTPDRYVANIDLPNLIPENKYELVPIPDSLITEFNLEQKTITVKADNFPKDLYCDLENIILDTFPRSSGCIIIDGVEVPLVDIEIEIEDENGDLVAVPWTNEKN